MKTATHSSAVRAFVAGLPAGTSYAQARSAAAATGLRLNKRLFYRWRFLIPARPRRREFRWPASH